MPDAPIVDINVYRQSKALQASIARHPSSMGRPSSPRRTQTAPTAMGPWSTARYAFPCPLCGEIIDAGETVYRRDTLEGDAWICPCCVNDIDSENNPGGDAA